MKVELTYWERLREPVGRPVRTTWDAFCARLHYPREAAAKLELPGFSFASFAGYRRALANVERVYAVGLDLDAAIPSWEVLLETFEGWAFAAHTTFKSRPDDLRARVFLPLSRAVDAAEYRRVYEWCVFGASHAGLVVDRAASDPSRLWFVPARSTLDGAEYRYAVGRGVVVDVDEALRAVPAVSPPTPQVELPRVRTVGAPDVEARAAAYLERHDLAVSGAGGHAVTFLAAQRVVRGFDLDRETAFRLLLRWNARCSPPWSDRELRRKIVQADETGTMVRGVLRDARGTR